MVFSFVPLWNSVVMSVMRAPTKTHMQVYEKHDLQPCDGVMCSGDLQFVVIMLQEI